MTRQRRRASAAKANIDVSQENVADFCKRHAIRKLALFGSVLRDDFRPDSDVDVLIEGRERSDPPSPGLHATKKERSRAPLD